jgi:hypothetical protein
LETPLQRNAGLKSFNQLNDFTAKDPWAKILNFQRKPMQLPNISFLHQLYHALVGPSQVFGKSMLSP